MKYLLTGGSGFLGNILQSILEKEHHVLTLGRTTTNNLIADLSREIPVLPKVDVVIHAAGKAHIVPKTEEEKQAFFKVNVEGTRNLLKGIKEVPRTFVLISTVAVYGLEQGLLIDEESELLGETPYASSKIEAERLVQEWGDQNNVNVLVLRLPLIVGEDAPGNLGAMIKAIRKGYYFRLGSGDSKKSMVMASDIGDLLLDCDGKCGVFNLTDGEDPAMLDFDTYLAFKMSKKVRPFPMGALKLLAKIGDKVPKFPLNTYRLEKLQHSLTFSTEKAKKELGWNPNPVIGSFNPVS